MQPLQAKESCNFIEFTDMIHRLLKAAWGNDWGTFCEAFPNGKDPENVEMPIITYRIISKVPGLIGKDGAREIKPRHRQDFDLTDVVDGGPEKISIYSQVFDYRVMFDIWHENNTKADLLAERFEDFMTIYTGYMMSQGVGQIFFIQMTGDDGRIMLGDQSTSRHYTYQVRLEKHIAVPTAVIKAVIASVSVYANLSDEQDESIEAIRFKS